MKNTIIKKLNDSKDKKKKDGFTIIELIAVMAIISILAIVAFPKISAYITRAKETKVLAKAREVAMAAESFNCTTDTPIADGDTYSNFKSKLVDSNYIEIKEDAIDGSMKYSELENIMSGSLNYKVSDNKIMVK